MELNKHDARERIEMIIMLYWLIIGILVIIGACIGYYCRHLLSLGLGLSLGLNLVTEAIGIIVSVFLINFVFKYYEDQRIKTIIGQSYEALIYIILQYIVSLKLTIDRIYDKLEVVLDKKDYDIIRLDVETLDEFNELLYKHIQIGNNIIEPNERIKLIDIHERIKRQVNATRRYEKDISRIQTSVQQGTLPVVDGLIVDFLAGHPKFLENESDYIRSAVLKKISDKG